MRTRIKVCGVTTPDDAAMASRAGADFVGVVLTESPRRVTTERAREIAIALPAETLLVAVFADEPPAEVARRLDGLPVHAVQVRGWEDPPPGTPFEVRRVAPLGDPIPRRFRWFRSGPTFSTPTMPIVPAAPASAPTGNGRGEA